MRKEASMDLWKTLYNLAGELKELNPWEELWDLDIIGIQENGKDEPVFVSIMGKNEGKKAVAMYDGTRGLASFQQTLAALDTPLRQDYVMYEQESLTLHFGERIEVPEEQMAIIKELGLKFAGKGNWPYFLSFKPRYAPWTPDSEEVRLMAETLVQLIEAVKAMREKRAEIDFEAGEFCYRYFDQEELNWMTAPAKLPMASIEYDVLELADGELMESLENAPQNEENLVMDFVYLGGMSKDEKYERPVNPLLFIAMEESTQNVLHADVIWPEDAENEMALEFLIFYTQQTGCKPKRVLARCPYILAGLQEICEKMGVELMNLPLPQVDKVLEDMMAQM